MALMPRLALLVCCWMTAIGLSLLLLLSVRHQSSNSCWRAGGAGWTPLHITGPAEGAFPPEMAGSQLQQCLRRRPATRLLFVGHSRVRQLFETLLERLQLPLLSRAQLRRRPLPPAADFVDQQPLPADWRPFAADNSSCLGVWPKPRGAGQPADAWCSLAADSDAVDADDRRVRLEFRWRHGLRQLEDALRRATAACGAGLCPQLLVIGQGIHFLAGGGAAAGRMHQFQRALQRQRPLLAQLAARGVHVVWMLEQPNNPYFTGVSYNDDLLVLNALTQETVAAWRRPRPRVWTALIPVVAHFWTDACFARLPHLSYQEGFFCSRENYHVLPETRAKLIDQLLRYLCEDS